jgi:hypothetical protein
MIQPSPTRATSSPCVIGGAAEVLPDSTSEARRGLAVAQIFGGIVTLVGGLTGKVLGPLCQRRVRQRSPRNLCRPV